MSALAHPPAEPTRSYASAVLTEVRFGDGIRSYLERIDATLAPFDGRFLIHGGLDAEVEGSFPGDLILIEFPTPDGARRWYESAAYQAIIGLRADNSEGSLALFHGVEQPHRATDILAAG